MKLYSRLFVSRNDICFAQYCVDTIIKKRWHVMPWERRGTVYLQQAAFTTALVTAYVRPFTTSNGWPNLPQELLAYTPQQMELHNKIRNLRNKIYAHSDSESYSIRLWQLGTSVVELEGLPAFRIAADEAIMFREMTATLIGSITAAIDKLKQKAGEPE